MGLRVLIVVCLAGAGLIFMPLIRRLMLYRNERPGYKQLLDYVNPKKHKRGKKNFMDKLPHPKDAGFESLGKDGQSENPQTLKGRRAPGKSRLDFQHPFDSNNSVDFYIDCMGVSMGESSIRFSVVFQSLSHALFFGFLSMIVSFVAYQCSEEEDWGCAAVFQQQMNAIYSIYAVLSPLLIFILAVYVKNRMSWWFELKTKCWRLQGGIQEMALNMAISLPGNGYTDENIFGESRMEVKYRIYRYLCLIHYFTYFQIHKDVKRVPMQEFLQDSQLIEESEKEYFINALEDDFKAMAAKEKQQDNKRNEKCTCRYCCKILCCVELAFSCCRGNRANDFKKDEANYLDDYPVDLALDLDGKMARCNSLHRIPLLWLSQLVGYLVRYGGVTNFEGYQLYAALRRIRGEVVGLMDHNGNNPPYSWMQLLQIYVDFVLLLTPFALYGLVETYMTDDGGFEQIRFYNQMWNCIGTVASAVIFQSMLEMVRAMDDSWGTDLDDLNANSLLLNTERTIFFYLSEKANGYEESPWHINVEDEQVGITLQTLPTSAAAAASKSVPQQKEKEEEKEKINLDPTVTSGVGHPTRNEPLSKGYKPVGSQTLDALHTDDQATSSADETGIDTSSHRQLSVQSNSGQTMSSAAQSSADEKNQLGTGMGHELRQLSSDIESSPKQSPRDAKDWHE